MCRIGCGQFTPSEPLPVIVAVTRRKLSVVQILRLLRLWHIFAKHFVDARLPTTALLPEGV